MNEAEFMELARQKWAQFQDLKFEESFYEFEP